MPLDGTPLVGGKAPVEMATVELGDPHGVLYPGFQGSTTF